MSHWSWHWSFLFQIWFLKVWPCPASVDQWLRINPWARRSCVNSQSGRMTGLQAWSSVGVYAGGNPSKFLFYQCFCLSLFLSIYTYMVIYIAFGHTRREQAKWTLLLSDAMQDLAQVKQDSTFFWPPFLWTPQAGQMETSQLSWMPTPHWGKAIEMHSPGSKWEMYSWHQVHILQNFLSMCPTFLSYHHVFNPSSSNTEIHHQISPQSYPCCSSNCIKINMIDIHQLIPGISEKFFLCS